MPRRSDVENAAHFSQLCAEIVRLIRGGDEEGKLQSVDRICEVYNMGHAKGVYDCVDIITRLLTLATSQTPSRAHGGTLIAIIKALTDFTERNQRDEAQAKAFNDATPEGKPN